MIAASCHSDKEVEVINRTLIVAGISAVALAPGVAWACPGDGHGGGTGATGSTGTTGASGSTGTTGVTGALVRPAHFRHAHRVRARGSARRS